MRKLIAREKIKFLNLIAFFLIVLVNTLTNVLPINDITTEVAYNDLLLI